MSFTHNGTSMKIDVTTLRRSIAILMHVAFERFRTDKLQLLAELSLTLCEVSDLNTLVRSYTLLLTKTKAELEGVEFEYPLLSQLEKVVQYYGSITND